jgi:hypothetical protein
MKFERHSGTPRSKEDGKLSVKKPITTKKKPQKMIASQVPISRAIFYLKL